MEKLRGKVIWFDQKKGFGFISREGMKDLFVHYKNIVMEGFKTLEAEVEVEFTMGANHKGEQAENVVVVKNEA